MPSIPLSPCHFPSITFCPPTSSPVGPPPPPPLFFTCLLSLSWLMRVLPAAPLPLSISYTTVERSPQQEKQRRHQQSLSLLVQVRLSCSPELCFFAVFPFSLASPLSMKTSPCRIFPPSAGPSVPRPSHVSSNWPPRFPFPTTSPLFS